MITDTELKINAYKILADNLGDVLAERFIALVQREKFDYTKWQRNLWEELPVQNISKKAMEGIDKKINNIIFFAMEKSLILSLYNEHILLQNRVLVFFLPMTLRIISK